MRTASAPLFVVALAFPLALIVCAAPARGEEVNRIVLRVNDKIATLAQYNDRRDGRIAAVARAAELPADERRKLAADAGRSAMREIFEELLVLSRAQQLRLEASPSEIDGAVDNARRRFGVASDEEFERGLAESGSSMAEFRTRMAQNLIFNEVLQREIQPRIKVDDEEIARYWREHQAEFNVLERRKVEELVVRDSAGATADERRALAAALRDLLVEGKSLADAIAAQGAAESTLVLDHGWIERGTLDAQLETTVLELGAGGIGGPIDGRGGLHILRLIEIDPAKVKPLDQVRPEITNKLQEGLFETESAKYLDELATHAFVVESLPPDAIGYRTASAGERDPVRELMRGGRETDKETPPAEATPETSASTPPAQFRRR